MNHLKLIIGLGNPGEKYEYTKHNIGFLTVDNLANQIGVNNFTKTTSKFNALITEARIDGQKILLVKPLTYMNLSGEAVRPIIDWYKVDIDDMVVIYDDLDLPLGKIRYREKGSAGGHNGMKSIIQHLQTESFKRIRIGIGRSQHGSVVDYVLTTFSKEEKEDINQSLDAIGKSIIDWARGTEFHKLMNKYGTNK